MSAITCEQTVAFGSSYANKRGNEKEKLTTETKIKEERKND